MEIYKAYIRGVWEVDDLELYFKKKLNNPQVKKFLEIMKYNRNHKKFYLEWEKIKVY